MRIMKLRRKNNIININNHLWQVVPEPQTKIKQEITMLISSKVLHKRIKIEITIYSEETMCWIIGQSVLIQTIIRSHHMIINICQQTLTKQITIITKIINNLICIELHQIKEVQHQVLMLRLQMYLQEICKDLEMLNKLID